MKVILAALALGAAMASAGAALADSADDPAMAPARQTYRDSCARFESRDYCECMGSGLSHALSVSDMRLATRLMTNRLAPRRAGAITGYDAATLQEATQRINAVETQMDGACVAFRRGAGPQMQPTVAAPPPEI